jgi:hypothetical protein
MEIFPWEIVKTIGPAASIIVFFVWRDWQREIKLTKRVDDLEKYQKDTLERLVEKSTVALTQSTECLKWIGRVIERLARLCPKMIGQDCEKPESN